MSLEFLGQLIKVAPWIGVAGMVIAFITYFVVKKYPEGTDVMKKISDEIHLGAFVFLKREYRYS